AEASMAQRFPADTDLRDLLGDLEALYRPRGVNLVRVAGGWTFRTAPDLAPRLRLEATGPRRLSRAAVQTMAIIADHPPVPPRARDQGTHRLSPGGAPRGDRGDSRRRHQQGPPRHAHGGGVDHAARPAPDPRPPRHLGHHRALPRPFRPGRPRGPAGRRGA